MNIVLARQMASFAGALMILVAYAGHQMKWMDERRAAYNVLNAVGSAILAYIAFEDLGLELKMKSDPNMTINRRTGKIFLC
ncbi:MAG: hypothetical protein DMG75_03080 [Acidobacteria bacterium]|nr:MAG: hypothetical protein DMG75_03080 [Acidobacteriota bacterium]